MGGIWGSWMGLTVFILIVIALYTLADKFFLSLGHSQRLSSRDPFVERVKNLAFCDELSPPQVFISSQLPDNIYVLDSLTGRPSLLITPGIHQKWDEGPLEWFIVQALKKAQARTALHHVASSCLLALIGLPAQVLKRWKWTYYGGLTLGLLMVPLGLLKDYIIHTPENLDKSREIPPMASRESPPGDSLVLQMAQDIGMIPCSRRGLWNYIMNPPPTQGIS